MEATVDLGTISTLSSVTTGFLQDINSWIFMPVSVVFEVSADGSEFRKVGELASPVPPDSNGAIVHPFSVAFPPAHARYVRVSAASMKTCPPWHKGAGGLAWIFADEIVIR